MIPFKRSIVNVRKIYRPFHPPTCYFESPSGERRARPCLYSTSAALFKATVARTTKSLAELPSHKVDNEGNKIGPLPPYVDGMAKKNTKGKGNKGTKRKGAQDADAPRDITNTEASPSDLTAQYKAAVARGEVPDTPLAEEVYTNWKRFPDAILLTRVGKFYESYFAPAVDLSNLLSLKLAYKKYSGGNFPFSGFPVTQIDKYLKILVQDLRRTVVLVEEYDEEGRREPFDPIRKVATGSGAELKDRRVGRVVTPGTLVEETWVSGDESRYLLAVAVEDAPNGGETRISLAYTDPSTGEFFLKDTTAEYLEDEMARITPREVVLDVRNKSDWMSGDQTDISARSELDDLFQLLRVLGIHVSFADPRRPFSEDSPDAVTTMLPAVPLETQAISILRHHLQYALRDSMPELTSPNKQSSGKTMLIDAATLAALEIRHAIKPGGLVTSSDTFGGTSPLSTRGTLLSTMSQTMTPSGHRLLVRTLTAPSTDIDDINTRLDLVEEFVDREELRTDLRDMIRGIADVMRVVQRFKGRRGDERDAWDVGTWIRAVERVKQRLLRDLGDGESGLEPLRTFVQSFKPLFDLAGLIEGSLDEAAVMKQGLSVVAEGEDGEEMEIQAGDAMIAESSGKKGETKKEQQDREKAAREQKWFMKTHFSAELKAMHEALEKMQDQRAKMQRDLQKKLGVEKLELTKNRNTFVMSLSARLDFAKIDKLRQFANILETKSGKSYAYNPWSALGAKTERHMEDMQFAQRRAFDQLRDMIIERAEDIQHNAALMDQLDVCLSFAQTAADLGYVRPELDDSTDLEIIDGRHPTVESSLLNSSRSFTPNSTHMDPSSHLHIITGPNQGGKSTLLRQTAVIAILAQAGSFVPASHVRMGIVDRVFSRIGARDDLFRDRSTFMLEMVETAAILRHATERSLVIMDEIGRGTTLHSGLSIAYATLDHILTKIRCRTLFATHYHEVADMLSLNEQVRDGVEFWCTDVDEVDGAFSYQYRLQRGINHKSHAIKAARLAGMPDSFLQTASNTLDALDSGLKPGEALRPDNEEPRSGALV